LAAHAARIDAVLAEHLDVLAALRREAIPAIERATDRLVATYRGGGKVLIFGNGGSSSDAQHIEGELVNRFGFDRAGLPAIALSAAMPTLTSIANDASYEDVFARPVEALCRPEDCVIAITTSGRSPNVLKGLATARSIGAGSILFTGIAGRTMLDAADVVIAVPSSSTARIQEGHITVAHVLCGLVEETLFPEGTREARLFRPADDRE